MECMKPFVPFGYAPVRCGRCLACRYYTKHTWTTRLILESMDYEDVCFITLTYNNDSLPIGSNLSKTELQNYQKRLRYELGYKIRFYSVGEYGDSRGRPHYHLLAFGMNWNDRLKAYKAWQNKGIVEIQKPLDSQSVVSYVAGYVTKKLGTLQAQQDFYGDRIPPFQLQSKGLGLNAAYRLNLNPLVPFFKLSNRKWFLGRYLTNKLKLLKFGEVFIETEKPIIQNIIYEMYDKIANIHRAKYDAIPQHSRDLPLWRFSYNQHFQWKWDSLKFKDLTFNTRSAVNSYIPPPAVCVPPLIHKKFEIGRVLENSDTCLKIMAS